MNSSLGLARTIKLVLVGATAVLMIAWLAPISLSGVAGFEDSKPAAVANADNYVGSETCKACHEEQFANFSQTAHAKLAHLPGWPVEKQGCESCHGAGKEHVDAGGDRTLIRTFENETAKSASDTCLACHAGKEEHNKYRRGEHWRNDVGCTDCHSPHGGELQDRVESATFKGVLSSVRDGRAALKMLRRNEQQLCISCHQETKAQFTQPFHHQVLEGAMACSDCHNPHGGFEQKQLRLATGSDAACVKCHTDKQGPFVYEHAPLKVEGCAICHTPHGSNNAKLLKRADVRQLCLECHSNTLEIGAPNTPSFHNQANVRFQNCTVCHVKIHGSNTDHVFFR